MCIRDSIKADGDYFGIEDIEALMGALGEASPARARVRALVRTHFNEFATRLLSNERVSEFEAAFNSCERLWLMFPSFSNTVIESPNYWDDFMRKLLERNRPDTATLEVTAFFAVQDEHYSFEKYFAANRDEWQGQARLLSVYCAEVRDMSTACITDPHANASTFYMSEHGFIALARGDSQRWISTTARKYSQVIGVASADDAEKSAEAKTGFNPLLASVSDILGFLGRTQRQSVIGARS